MWHGIHGHDAVAQRFRATLRRNRLASTYLFVGPAGVGKRMFALRLAESLLCSQSPDEALDPCGRCESCRLIAAGNHPDLDVVGLPADKSSLPIDLFIGDKEHRNREGLCHRISLKPYLGRRRVAIIDDADRFNPASANCLLKTLEEPPPRSLLILLGTSPSKQLPTIRSRAQIVRFGPLEPAAVAEILVTTGAVSDRAEAERLAAFSEGSLERARQLIDPELWSFRERLLSELAGGVGDSVRLARAIQAFVDEAGKEATLRRDRLRTIVMFAEQFYRGLLRAQTGGPTSAGDEVLRTAIDASLARGDAASADRLTELLDRGLDTLEFVDRNANLALVIEKWCADLAHQPVAV
jgi:DNA polymerase-3 subunit delta'